MEQNDVAQRLLAKGQDQGRDSGKDFRDVWPSGMSPSADDDRTESIKEWKSRKTKPYHGASWDHDDRSIPAGDDIPAYYNSPLDVPREVKPKPAPTAAGNTARRQSRGRGKRPEQQIYVPRGRRQQQVEATNQEAPSQDTQLDQQPEQHYTEPAEAVELQERKTNEKVSRSRPPRVRPSGEVYVPRHRRMQQSEQGHTADDKTGEYSQYGEQDVYSQNDLAHSRDSHKFATPEVDNHTDQNNVVKEKKSKHRHKHSSKSDSSVDSPDKHKKERKHRKSSSKERSRDKESRKKKTSHKRDKMDSETESSVSTRSNTGELEGAVGGGDNDDSVQRSQDVSEIDSEISKDDSQLQRRSECQMDVEFNTGTSGENKMLGDECVDHAYHPTKKQVTETMMNESLSEENLDLRESPCENEDQNSKGSEKVNFISMPIVPNTPYSFPTLYCDKRSAHALPDMSESSDNTLEITDNEKSSSADHTVSDGINNASDPTIDEQASYMVPASDLKGNYDLVSDNTEQNIITEAEESVINHIESDAQANQSQDGIQECTEYANSSIEQTTRTLESSISPPLKRTFSESENVQEVPCDLPTDCRQENVNVSEDCENSNHSGAITEEPSDSVITSAAANTKPKHVVDESNRANFRTIVPAEPVDEAVSSNGGAAVGDAEEDEDGWETLFDDCGDALDPSIMDELTAAVGKVKVQKTQFDYYNYQPKEAAMDTDEYSHLIELYDFPKELITRDLLVAFRDFKDKGFDVKWVDDSHAIGVFSSSVAALTAVRLNHPLIKVRPISQASPQTKQKAKKCIDFLEPYKPRPETTAAVARNLVARALGMEKKINKEKRDADRKRLMQVKEQKRQAQRDKSDAWEGNFGRCAMDEV